MQIASGTSEISTLCVALDPTLETIRGAVDANAQFLLCHHPLTLAPKLPSILDDFHQILTISLRHRLCVYSAHTSLDANPEGPVNWLGRFLGLRDMRILEVTRRETPTIVRLPSPARPERYQDFEHALIREDAHGMEYRLWPEERNSFCALLGPGAPFEEFPLAAPQRVYGFGCIGTLPRSLSWSEFIATIGPLFATEPRIVGKIPPSVNAVAYCPGSGADLGAAAFAAGADVFLTGDVKYHQAQSLQDHGLTLDVGHFSLEETMMRLWCDDLTRQLSPEGVRVVYLPGRDPFA